MEKASVFFKRIMLALLLALLALTLLLMLGVGLESRSYLLAMAGGAVWAAGLWLLRKKRGRLFARTDLPAALSVTALCFVLNLAWVLLVRIEPFSDYETYWQVACALADATEIPSAWYVAM